MMMALIIAVTALDLLVIYSCIRISSKLSRQEEKEKNKNV